MKQLNPHLSWPASIHTPLQQQQRGSKAPPPLTDAPWHFVPWHESRPPDLVPAEEASGPNRASLSPSPSLDSSAPHRTNPAIVNGPHWAPMESRYLERCSPHKAKISGVRVSCELEPEGDFWQEEVCGFGPLSKGTVRPVTTRQRQELVPGCDGKYLPQMSAF